MPSDQHYSIPDPDAARAFIDGLVERFTVLEETSVFKKQRYYDTLDWRLYNKSLVLSACGNRLVLRKLKKNKPIHCMQISTMPVFARDFPAGEFQNHLAPIIKIRALVAIAALEVCSVPYRILNSDKKTVARLVYQRFQIIGGTHEPILHAYWCLKPVKGYTKTARKLSRRIQNAGFAAADAEALYINTLMSVNKTPGAYHTKIALQFDPEMRADEAVRALLHFLQQVMRYNETYIEMDLDTECLHDFRVAVRRTRSALGQIKEVIPPRVLARFKKDFAYIGKSTNALRDLDVYLLKEDEYRSMLPAALQEDIVPLFDYLKKRRTGALKQVIRTLKTKKYNAIMRDWNDFLQQPATDAADLSNAGRPIFELAREIITKKHTRIIKIGRRILLDRQDEKLHVLRIHCKKLRYLLEFFASLFPPRKVKALISQLKKLQDNLGDYHDLCVQRAYLITLIEEGTFSRQASPKTLAAIGSLIGTLEKKTLHVKNAFENAFGDFASPSAQALFQEVVQ